jgi:parvulin-like peptidyl-prolyl isomerase
VSAGARRLALLGALLAPFAGASAQGIYPGDAVRVNGVPISYQRFNGFYIEYRNSQGVAVGARGDQLALLTRLRREAMERIVEQELVGQAAEREGIAVEPEAVDAAVDALRAKFPDPRGFAMRLENEGFTLDSYRAHVARMIAAKRYLDAVRAAVAPVSDEALEAYYRDNERRLTFPEQVRVRHILITWKPLGTRDDRAAIREQMQPILARARAGEDFAALARELSDDYATREAGGDTGLFHRGQMAPAFENAAFALEPGEISDPVETAYGVHILRLEERREARLLPLDEVRDQLREHVAEERAERAVEEEIERLRAAAEIQVLIPLERSASK